MLQAVKVRLYPNSTQYQAIEFQFGAARFVYNYSLSLRKFAYTKFGKNVGKFDLTKRITKLKKSRFDWLKNADSQALQASLANMDMAYKHFFKGGGFPKFKSKHHHRQSYQYPQRVKLNVDDRKVYLPKVGWVKMRGYRNDFIGTVKTVTVSREGEQYFASILLDMEDVVGTNNGKAVGLDVGVVLMVADSLGGRSKALNLEKELTKLRRAAQSVSRKKRGSKNRDKAKKRLNRVHKKIANQRKDFLHKLSKLYSENQTVVVEKLNVKSMSRSAKGTKEKPGKNVSAKRGLNRKITQASWGMFFEFSKYKVERNGGQYVEVDPKYTSQTCSSCGHIDKESRKSQSRFVCTKCGHTQNADTNAAINILRRGVPGQVSVSKVA